jgi:hypothetical protein
MPLHELIDRENPKCLYCDTEFGSIRQIGDVMLAPIGSSAFGMRLEAQILKCQKCHEIFEIHWTETQKNETTYQIFVFTCNGIVVVNWYQFGFVLGSEELLCAEEYYTPSVKKENFIPEFPVDFSDKKKLHKKLKTYLVFS